MLDMGVIRHSSPGFFHLLPLGLRSLDKLIKIVDTELQSVGAQKLCIPALTNAELWKKTGSVIFVVRINNDCLNNIYSEFN